MRRSRGEVILRIRRAKGSIVIALSIGLLLVMLILYVASRALTEGEAHRAELPEDSLDSRERRAAAEFAEHFFPQCPDTARALREILERSVGDDISWLHPADSPWHPNLVGEVVVGRVFSGGGLVRPP